jgi:hypothetical protein
MELPSLSKTIEHQQFVIVKLNTRKGTTELKIKDLLHIIKYIQPVSQRLPQPTDIWGE